MERVSKKDNEVFKRFAAAQERQEVAAEANTKVEFLVKASTALAAYYIAAQKEGIAIPDGLMAMLNGQL